AALSPRISGLVDSVDVDAGDRVERGQRLLQLDATLARLALRSAEAAVREARTRLQEAQRLQSEGESLAAQGSLPQSLYQTRRAEAALAEAALAGLEAERDVRAEQLARHALPAPFAGIVSRRLVAPGEWVETGTAVLELVATTPLRVDVQVPQQQFRAITADTEVEVRVDADPDRVIPARVEARVPIADPQARSFLVRVAVDEPPPTLTPGMSVRVRFELPGTQAAVSIPRDAVLRFPDGSTIVWVLSESGEQSRASRRPVKLGVQRGDTATVVEGLSGSDRVVVRGNEALQEGQSVVARPFSPGAR
ncbi:MAG: efflux RND transporter periplasmic adaptor subunit, partial [Gammaproteobacteria bacterium]